MTQSINYFRKQLNNSCLLKQSYADRRKYIRGKTPTADRMKFITTIYTPLWGSQSRLHYVCVGKVARSMLVL